MNRKPLTVILAILLLMAAYGLGMSSQVSTERTAQSIPQSMLAKGDDTKQDTSAPVPDAGAAGQVLLYEPARSANIRTFLDHPASGNVGTYTSITIGADGLPLISYRDTTNNRLKIAHCLDVACVGSTLTSVTGSFSQHTSITIGSNGFGVVSFYDPVSQELKLLRCLNTACTSNTTVVIDTDGNVGQFNAIGITPAGVPVISYYDATNGNLKLAICDSTTCATPAIKVLDSDNNVGQFTSLAFNHDALLLISYYDVTKGDLVVASCSFNIISPCPGAARTVIDSIGTVGLMSSIAIGEDNKPIISYYDLSNQLLMAAHCSDTECLVFDSKNKLTYSGGQIGINSSIAIGLDGRPVISSYNQGSDSLTFIRCHEIDCSGINEFRTLNLQGGSNTSVTIGVDGFPIISYYDTGAQALTTIHCGSVSCLDFQRRR